MLFTQIDLASGYNDVSIAENDRYQTAFGDANWSPCEFSEAEFGLAVQPADFTCIVERALRNRHPDVVSWLDDMLISRSTWQEHIIS